MILLAPLVTAFFRQHLAVEKGVSKPTLASYSYKEHGSYILHAGARATVCSAWR